mgnify:CR=1 FL=1
MVSARMTPDCWKSAETACSFDARPAVWLPAARLPGLTLEEQHLADDCRYGCRLERLGDQERRLRTLAGEEALRIGGDEHHRHLEGTQQFVDRIKPGRTVGELDVGQDQAGLAGPRQRHRVRMGAGDAEDVVAEILHQAFEVHRDECFVLDDENARGHLPRDFRVRLAQQFLDPAHG